MPANPDLRSSITSLPSIENVELFHVRLPLQRPFRTSFGREAHRDSVLIRLCTPHGDGWGEAPVGRYPRYTHESSETAWYVLSEFLGPALIRTNPTEFNAWSEATPFIRGHRMARSAAVMALVDLAAKEQNESLGTFYGAERNEARAGISIGIKDDREHLLDQIDEALDQGYPRIKVKIEPGADLDLLRDVRDAFPDVDLMVDGNGGYSARDIDHLEAIDPFDLMMLEQPFSPRDLTSHAELQNRIETPICLDETVETLGDAEVAQQLSACRIINIKSPRLGGPVHALDVYRFCDKHQMGVFCGGLLETGIGRAHNVGLASLPNFELPGDLSASHRYFPRDIVDPEFELTDRGTLKLPDGTSGIGVTPDLDRIRRHAERKARYNN